MLWKSRVAQWHDCGLSQRAFALQQVYSQRQLNYWVRRLGERDAGPALLPVVIKQAASPVAGLSLRNPNGWTVMLPAELPMSAVAELLRAL